VTDDVKRQITELLPRLRRFARALTGDQDRADDLVQETCLRALSRLDQWERGTRLDSWMYRIAQNIWVDRARASKVRGDVVELEDALEVSGEDGRATTEGRLMLAEVERAMGRLPAEQRIVVGLVYVEGLAYGDAADVLGVPVGTVMSRLARARRALFVAVHGTVPDDRADAKAGSAKSGETKSGEAE
jgi:RNA polymerase sigma-70 factor (ECF subfamily)